MEKIDIIIPAYKAHETLGRALASIACQTIVDKIKVTVVNDCCPQGSYKHIIRHFTSFLDIQELKLKENVGPGAARQYGIDHTSNDYIVFMDADDTFYGAFALRHLYSGLKYSPESVLCVTTFLEETEGELASHNHDHTWLHGKIYRRKFLKENNIRFSNLRANEDVGFNSLCMVFADRETEVQYSEIPTYIWHIREDSITKINKDQYRYDQSICGWIEHAIITIETAEQSKCEQEKMVDIFWELFSRIYFMYSEIQDNSEVFKEQAWYYCRKFWNRCGHLAIGTEQEIRERYMQYIADYIMASSPLPFTFHIGFFEFIELLNNTSFDENEIKDITARIPSEFRKANIQCGVVGE